MLRVPNRLTDRQQKIELLSLFKLSRAIYKTSRSQSLKVPRSQGLKVSESQGLKVSRSQGFKVSRSQGLKVSRRRVKIPHRINREIKFDGSSDDK